MTTVIPKKIYTYWDDLSKTTKLLEKCLKSLRDLNPDWEVIIYTDKKMPKGIDYPKNYNKLIVQHKSDFLRLWLLKNKGGIWVDASILFKKPIDEIYDLSFKGIQVYTPPPFLPIKNSIENWFIIAPENDNFIAEWYKRFRLAIVNGPHPMKYFTMHEISLDLLKEFPNHPIKKMNSCLGPLKQVCKSLYLPVTYGIFVQNMIENPNEAVVKLTGHCREMYKNWPLILCGYILLFISFILIMVYSIMFFKKKRKK